MSSQGSHRRASLAAGLLLAGAALAVLDALVGGWFIAGPAVLVVAGAAAATGALHRPTHAFGMVLVAAGMMTVASQVEDPDAYTPLNDLVFFLIVTGAPALAGATWAGHARQAGELVRLTERRAAQRSARVRTAALEERTRLVDEAHRDVVQILSAVAVQAEGASRSDPPTVLGSLERIETNARAALAELRDRIGTLRLPEPLASTDDDASPPATVRPPLGPIDVLAALTVLPLAVESVLGGAAHGPAWANVAMSTALAAPLLLRRRAALLSTIAFLGGCTVMSASLTELPDTVTVILPLLLCAYAVGAHQRWWVARGAGLLVLAAGTVLVAAVSPTADQGPEALPPTLVMLGLAVLAGVAAAYHEDTVHALDRLLADIEAGRDAEVRLAVAEQRNAVARDLHDTVAAAMTIVCLHADAARRAGPEDPRARESLATITDTVRACLAELRTSFETLDAAGPALTLDAVVDQARQTGLEVTTVPARICLAPGIAPLAARIVREALVNVLRHAPGAAVEVHVEETPAEVTVTVTDSGAAGSPRAILPGTGHGLIGLTEAVESIGGRLRHGPLDSRGFRVAATLPLRAAART